MEMWMKMVVVVDVVVRVGDRRRWPEFGGSSPVKLAEVAPEWGPGLGVDQMKKKKKKKEKKRRKKERYEKRKEK